MTSQKIKTMNTISFKGKTTFLRVDINSQVIKNKPIISPRIEEHAKTIAELKKKGAKVIVVSYQSRKGKKDFISLKEHAKLLNKKTKIKFVEDIIGKKAEKAIKELKNGEAILLENIRFLPDEKKPSKKNKIITFFKDKIDFYVNDAFSVSHRNETTISILTKVMGKNKEMGRVFEK